MTIDETKLRTLMANLESDWIERTQGTRDTEKLSQAICAFANDFPNHGHPGYLLIGVDDKTGAAVGKEIGDDVLQRLGGLRSDGNIQPLPAITVTRISLSDGSGDVAVVEVHPSDMPPVRYKGRIWIRIGPRKGISTYRGHAVSREVIEENHRSLPEQMASLRMFDLRRTCPTNAGILLFGKDPRFWIIGAYVQFLRIIFPSRTITAIP